MNDMVTASYSTGKDIHEVDWAGFVEEDDEYAGRCACGWRTAAWAEDVVEAELQRHVDDWDGGPDAE